MLATGDPVIGLGHLGEDGFTLLDIAADGRLLIAGSLSDGRMGLFWADAHRLDPVWVAGDEPGVRVDFQRTRVGGVGRIVAQADDASQPDRGTFFYVFSPDAAAPEVVAPGRDGGDGSTICWVDHGAVDDTGTIAFLAEITPPGERCFEGYGQPDTAIYVVSDGAITRVIGSGDEIDFGTPVEHVDLVTLARDGTIVASVVAEGAPARIVAVRRGTVHTLVARGDSGPDGLPLTELAILSANGLGEILFAATEGSQSKVFRTDRGRIVGVDFGLPLNVREWALSDGGDVAAATTPGSEPAGVFLLAAEGNVSVIFPLGAGTELGSHVSSTGPLRFSARGDLAFAARVHGGTASLRALRWSAGRIESVVATGDAAPGVRCSPREAFCARRRVSLPMGASPLV